MLVLSHTARQFWENCYAPVTYCCFHLASREFPTVCIDMRTANSSSKRHATDRQTDRHRPSFHNASLYGGRGIITIPLSQWLNDLQNVERSSISSRWACLNVTVSEFLVMVTSFGNRFGKHHWKMWKLRFQTVGPLIVYQELLTQFVFELLMSTGVMSLYMGNWAWKWTYRKVTG